MNLFAATMQHQPGRLLQRLRQELNHFLQRFPQNTAECAFHYGMCTFNKTRFCSHINFLSKCLHLRLIPNGFRIKHGNASGSRTNIGAIDKATDSCSRRIMRITLGTYQRTRTRHHNDRLFYANYLSNLCTQQQFFSIRDFIHHQNRRYFNCLQNVKESKVSSLKEKIKVTRNNRLNSNLVVTIPEDLPITEPERNVLAKGLKYVPVTKHVDQFQVLSDAQQFYRRLRLKAYFHSQEDEDSDTENDDTPLSPPPTSYLQELQKTKSDFTPKEGQLQVLDYYIDKCENEINKLNFNQQQRRRNINPDEEKALKSLRQNPNIVIKPADKGGAIVVWRKDLYIAEAERQLSDETTYERQEQDITKQHQETVRDTITDLVNSEELPQYAMNLINPNPRTSKFYLLPKIHKPNTPGRPIVSACNCPTERISQYLDETLRPIVESLPTYVKDSPHALRLLQEVQLHENPLLFTMDVRSLYTSIPHQEGLRALKHFLDKRSNPSPSTDTLLRLAELVLTLNCFEFDGKFYLQKRGVKMGSRFGPIYACLFMGYVEQQFISEYTGSRPQIFLRYIDDIFGIANCNEDVLVSFMEFINGFHPALQYTWEISPSSVTFLDMNISIKDNHLSTSIHYKPTDSHSYLTYSSSHPRSCKNSIPYSQLLRLRRLCSDDNDFDTQAKKMGTFFQERGYPSDITTAALQRCQTITREESLRIKEKDTDNCQRTPLVITYHPSIAPVSEIIRRNWHIISDHPSTKDIFTDPPIISYRRDKNIKDHLVRASLQSDDPNTTVGTSRCQRRRCNTCKHVLATSTITGPKGDYHIKKAFTCTTSHVVYAICCKRHKHVMYIGETERRLADRFTEHRRDILIRDLSKPVPQHFTTSNHTIDDVTVTALTQVHDASERKIKEQRIIFQLGTLQPAGMNIKFTVFNARM